LYRADAFLATECNAQALAWITRPGAWPGGRLAVFGEPGCGKTHVLHVFADREGAVVRAGGTLRERPAEMPRCAIVLDDADLVPSEEALLHVLNAAAEAGVPVLLAGRSPPSRWPVALPDLVSRLRATTSVGIAEPDDALLAALLARLLAERQMVVSETVQAFLLARLPRTGAAVREAAALLDRASLAAGGRVTRAMAEDVLAVLG
jgi:chromosomal replication initiation ATPase DnaA